MPLAKVSLRRYPAMIDAMEHRHEHYNEELEYIREKEERGGIVCHSSAQKDRSQQSRKRPAETPCRLPHGTGDDEGAYAQSRAVPEISTCYRKR